MDLTQTRIVLGQLRRSYREAANEHTDLDLLGRFAAGDQHAFTTLVQRHGSMVLGVCRGVLHNRADAEDAFQAVFLALARKASHSFSGGCLSGWLHAVARRAASNLRCGAARRRKHERHAGEQESNFTSTPRRADLREALDEEVSRLPKSCREAILRCYFDGQTRDQAAHQLGWSLRTLERRLEQGRTLLRERLTARGTTLAVLLALAPAAVPSALADVAVRAALGEAPARVVELAGSVLAGLAALRAKFVFVFMFLLSLVAGTALALLPGANPPVPAASAPPTPPGQLPAVPPPLEEPLPKGALARLGSTRFWHGFLVHGLVYSKDGKVLASAGRAVSSSGRGRALCLWDAETGRLLHQCGAPARVQISYCVALSPDGRYAASDQGVAVRLWSVKTGKEVRQFTGHTATVQSVAYSPSGHLLASGGQDNTVRLWDPATGRQVHLLQGHGASVERLAFRHDGKVLASGSRDGEIRLWNASTGTLKHVCKGHGDSIVELVFEPEGNRLVSASFDGSVRVWNSDTGNQQRTLITGKQPLHCLAFSPDGKTLAIGAGERDNERDESLRLHDFATGKELRRWTPEFFRARCVAWSPDGKTLACGSSPFDGTVHLLDPQTGKEKTPRSGHTGSVRLLAFHKSGQRLLSYSNFDIRLLDWDLATKTSRPLQLSDREKLRRSHVAITPDGKFLASASREETETKVRLFDTSTGKEERPFTGAAKGPSGIAFSPNGQYLASASQDRNLRLWRTRTRALLWQTNMAIPPQAAEGIRNPLVFSPDGASLAFLGNDGVLRLFEAKTGKPLRKYSNSGTPISSMAWSPDSSLIALSYTGAPTISLLSVRTGEVGRSWRTQGEGEADSSITTIVAFSPDGRLLASTSNNSDCAVHLSEVTTGSEVAIFTGHVYPPETLVFSPDGRRLVSGGFDSLINIWDVTGRSADGKLRPSPVSAERFAQLWEKLAADDAKTAYAAVWELVSGGEAVVPMLKARMSPAKALDAKSASRIVAELDADDFATREKATKEAAKLGLGAEPALMKAMGGSPGLELRRRVDSLVSGWLRSTDWLRYRRAVAVLEHNGGAEAMQILSALASGAEGARPTKEAAAALARRDEKGK